jgi:hypothetical protein
MEQQQPDTAPGPYYVTVVRDGRGVGFLAGPFDQHADALAMVEPARAAAYTVDPWTAFDAFGTARWKDASSPAPIGKLNDLLGVT